MLSLGMVKTKPLETKIFYEKNSTRQTLGTKETDPLKVAVVEYSRILVER